MSIERIEKLRKAIESLKIRTAELRVKEEHQTKRKEEILAELKSLEVRPEDLKERISLLGREIEQGLQNISIPETLK